MEEVVINEFAAVKDDPGSDIIQDDVLNDLIAENATIQIDDDITMMIGFEGMPKPFTANSDEMIKRDEDPISHNMPYNLTVS